MSRLKAAKCPSCKIVLLRSIQGTSHRMYCPTCDMDYLYDHGQLGGICSIQHGAQVIQANKIKNTPRLNAEPGGGMLLTSHGHLLHTSLPHGKEKPRKSNKSVQVKSQNLLLPARTPIRRHSFQGTRDTVSSSVFPFRPKCSTLDNPRRGGCRRGASLQITNGSDTNATRITNTLTANRMFPTSQNNSEVCLASCPTKDESSTLHLPEISDTQRSDSMQSSHSSGKLGRIKQFFSSPVWSRKSSPRSDCSSASSGKGLELPPVLRKNRNSTEDSGSDTSLNGDYSKNKPILTSIDDLRQEYRTAKQNNNYDGLQEMFVNTFSSREEICNSFKDGEVDCDMTLLGINLPFMHYAYSVLLDLPQGIQKGVLRAIITGILKESRNHMYKLHAVNTRYLRSHICLIQNPQFHSINTYVVFAQLLRQLSLMSPQSHQCFVAWLQKHYTPEWLKALIAKIQQFISVRQFPPNPADLPPLSKCSWWISSAVKVLALINEANWSRSDVLPLVTHKEFYNTTLDYIDLMEDFYSWQNPQSYTKSPKFTYCQYPFILSMTAKQTILQRDSEHQMLIMAKKSLIEKVEQNQTPAACNFFLNLTIRRSHLVEDSINQLMQKQQDLKKKVRVTFSGEPGLDMGGLTKEWFLLLIKEVFQPEYGLFSYNKDSGYYWFNPGGLSDTYDDQNEYHLVGLLMGLAVYNNIILDLHFPPCCYKKLLTPPINPLRLAVSSGSDITDGFEVGIFEPSVGDLIKAMPTIGKSLKELKDHEGNVEELCYTFQVSHRSFGVTITTELLPNGKDIPVTSENRNDFVCLYLDHLLNRSITKQFTAFYCGFHSVCDSNALMLFRPEEIEMLICGCPEMDMKVLQRVTVYEGYGKTDITVKNFWEVVHGFTLNQQRMLLLFVTGTYRIPVEGMSSVRFKITKLPFPTPLNTNVLPVAHTCFNHLLLPPYKTKTRLKEKLVIAISNAEGFGMI